MCSYICRRSHAAGVYIKVWSDQWLYVQSGNYNLTLTALDAYSICLHFSCLVKDQINDNNVGNNFSSCQV